MLEFESRLCKFLTVTLCKLLKPFLQVFEVSAHTQVLYLQRVDEAQDQHPIASPLRRLRIDGPSAPQ